MDNKVSVMDNSVDSINFVLDKPCIVCITHSRTTNIVNFNHNIVSQLQLKTNNHWQSSTHTVACCQYLSVWICFNQIINGLMELYLNRMVIFQKSNMDTTIFALWVRNSLKCEIWDPILRISRSSQTYDNKIFRMIICNKSTSTSDNTHQMSHICDLIIFQVILCNLTGPVLDAFSIAIWCNCQDSIILWKSCIVLSRWNNLSLWTNVKCMTKG